MLPFSSIAGIAKKKRKLHDWGKVLLRFFSKTSLSLPEKHPELLKQLKENLLANTYKKVKMNVLDYLDFVEWIKEKCHQQ